MPPSLLNVVRVPGRPLTDLRSIAVSVAELVVLMREMRVEIAALREEVARLRGDVSSVPFVGRRTG